MVLSVQKIAQMLQVKSTGNRVDDTEIMRTSSSNPSSTVYSEDTSDSVRAMRQSGENTSVVQPIASIFLLQYRD